MNVKSAFLLAKDVIPLMEKRGFVVILMDFKGAVSLAEFFFVYFVTKVC